MHVLYFLSISRNLIYTDNPVGTGYSFTKNDKGYTSNEIQVANHNFVDCCILKFNEIQRERGKHDIIIVVFLINF
ncbi:hypothetical protein HZH66_009891 [Vespula vulgaris]|uniref:Uncharacterized protein n=1 Tax=Vespula vulgaris TaxID=7454 RepID=A0A834JTU6_VESVU|nr:hypothetical protein HZH66_009891 [Vespula vulgaris]